MSAYSSLQKRLRLVERMIEGHLIRLGNLRRERDELRDAIREIRPNDAEIVAKEEARQARIHDIMRRRREGATFRVIAREYGISATRVSQICEKAERLERRRARHEANQGDEL
jgi:hypothetical protein